MLIKIEKSCFCQIFVQALLFQNIRKQRHSPHLTVHSPHVASGKWVGQRVAIVWNIQKYKFGRSSMKNFEKSVNDAKSFVKLVPLVQRPL